MLEDSIIIDYINNEIENEFIDFKLNIYDWSNAKSKGDFLNAVICLANSNAKGDKYIITGVKVKPDGERIIKGIGTSQAKDSAIYQELVTENIEPSISIEFKIIGYDSKKLGIFRIFGCNDRPYLLKKKYGDYESGYVKVRRGSRNTNISFTIKNIKVGETMVLPGNIIIKNKIDSIGYSIISKNCKNKHIGKLIIKK